MTAYSLRKYSSEYNPIFFACEWDSVAENIGPSLDGVRVNGVSSDNMTDIRRAGKIWFEAERKLHKPISVVTKDNRTDDGALRQITVEERVYCDTSVPLRLGDLVPQIFPIAEEVEFDKLERDILEYSGVSVDKALNYLFEEIENRLYRKEYDFCNRFLERVDVEKHDIHVLIGLLTVSLPWRKTLFYRESLYERVKEVVCREYPAERAKRILAGLE